MPACHGSGSAGSSLRGRSFFRGRLGDEAASDVVRMLAVKVLSAPAHRSQDPSGEVRVGEWLACESYAGIDGDLASCVLQVF
jgi:hypothetical protein